MKEKKWENIYVAVEKIAKRKNDRKWKANKETDASYSKT